MVTTDAIFKLQVSSCAGNSIVRKENFKAFITYNNLATKYNFGCVLLRYSPIWDIVMQFKILLMKNVSNNWQWLWNLENDSNIFT